MRTVHATLLYVRAVGSTTSLFIIVPPVQHGKEEERFENSDYLWKPARKPDSQSECTAAVSKCGMFFGRPDSRPSFLSISKLDDCGANMPPLCHPKFSFGYYAFLCVAKYYTPDMKPCQSVLY